MAMTTYNLIVAKKFFITVFMSQSLFLIGSPVSHSRSPSLFNRWFLDHDIDASYNAMDVPSEDLPIFFDAIHNYRGGNVTAPHKEEALNYCTEIDETSELVGSVNTLSISDDGIIGYNTDVHGFQEGLKPFLGDITHAIVVGAGGASRAVLAVLEAHGVHVYLKSRTRARAEALAAQYGCDVIDDMNEYLGEVDVVVNATGQKTLPLDFRWAKESLLVHDLAHGDGLPLLRAAERHSLRTLDGSTMLMHQAAKSFEIWFGIDPLADL
jgi:shikimate dehydrogenase